MSAFIRLNKQDAFVVPYTAHKSFSLPLFGDSGSAGVEFYVGTRDRTSLFSSASLKTRNQYSRLVFGDPNNTILACTPPAGYVFASASWQGISSNSPFYNISGPTQVQAIDSQGITYDENTGVMTSTTSVYQFGDPSPDTILKVELLFVKNYIETYTISQGTNVGNIFYPHGIAIFNKTNQLVSLLKDSVGYGTSVNWQASHTIFQHQYRCRVNESSLNYSQNPSIKSGSNGDTYNFATGSYFQPYITTVGLYNDSNELIAVAKLGQPIPKSRYTDMTFVIALDI